MYLRHKVRLLVLLLAILGLPGQQLVVESARSNPRLSRAPRFSDDQLYNVSKETGVDKISGFIGCFGDFNSDKYTDIFVINPERTSITVYLWKSGSWSFEPSDVTIYPNMTISSIAAADFNLDGKLDLLVQGYLPSEPSENQIQVWHGDYQTLKLSQYLPPSIGQVIIAELNGDMYPDLFGVALSNSVRSVWVNSDSYWTVEPFGSDNLPPLLTESHSNSFVDLDGDCLADLFVTIKTSDPNTPAYEIWTGKYGTFTLVDRYSNIKGVPGAGQITFADFNADGAVDILFPVCYPAPDCSEDNSIRIIYNRQTPICESIFGGSNCRKDTELCTADPDFKIAPFNSPEGEDVVIIPKSAFGERRFYKSPNFDGGIQIRYADFNLDRYPDLLIPLRDGNGTGIEMWMNVPCDSETCSKEAAAAGRRTFKRIDKDIQALHSINNAFTAAPFSLDEAGRNDILVLKESYDAKTSQFLYGVEAVFNNFFNDAFFLKVLGLNGVCTIGCPITDVPDPKPYGVNQYGAMFKFSMTSMNGKSQTGTAVSLTQSAYLSLQTPYAVAGLSRPSNYVEFLFFGVPLKNEKREASRYWPGIIPNSQVVVSPYPHSDPANWLLELYISPSGITLWVTIAVIAWLIVLGAVVLILHWREKKEDEREKREMEHLFSFRAM